MVLLGISPVESEVVSEGDLGSMDILIDAALSMVRALNERVNTVKKMTDNGKRRNSTQ